jgi:hypothetical protein
MIEFEEAKPPRLQELDRRIENGRTDSTMDMENSGIS